MTPDELAIVQYLIDLASEKMDANHALNPPAHCACWTCRWRRGVHRATERVPGLVL